MRSLILVSFFLLACGPTFLLEGCGDSSTASGSGPGGSHGGVSGNGVGAACVVANGVVVGGCDAGAWDSGGSQGAGSGSGGGSSSGGSSGSDGGTGSGSSGGSSSGTTGSSGGGASSDGGAKDAGSDGGCGSGASLSTDPGNCGGCGHSCGGAACVDGVCQGAPIATGMDVCATDTENIFCIETDSGVPVTIAKATGAETPLGTGEAFVSAMIATDGLHVFVASDATAFAVYAIPIGGGVWTTAASVTNAGFAAYGYADPAPMFVLGSTAYIHAEDRNDEDNAAIFEVPATGAATSPTEALEGLDVLSVATDGVHVFYVMSPGSGCASGYCVSVLGGNTTTTLVATAWFYGFAVDATSYYVAYGYYGAARDDGYALASVSRTTGDTNVLIPSGGGLVSPPAIDGDYVYFGDTVVGVQRVATTTGALEVLEAGQSGQNFMFDAAYVYWIDASNRLMRAAK